MACAYFNDVWKIHGLLSFIMGIFVGLFVLQMMGFYHGFVQHLEENGNKDWVFFSCLEKIALGGTPCVVVFKIFYEWLHPGYTIEGLILGALIGGALGSAAYSSSLELFEGR